MTNKIKTSKTLKTSLAVVIGLTAIWLALPYYLKKALTYWYPNIDDYKIFNNRVVKASKHPTPWVLSENYNKKQLSQTLRDTLDHYGSIAYLVIQNNKIIFEKYWEGYGPASYSNSFSMAKSIVSLLVGIAIDEGKINSVDDPAYKYLPFLNEGKGRELTIRDLLTMSSGSNWNESYNSPGSVTTQAYYGDDLKDLIEKLRIVDDPGKHFIYKSGDTQMLSMILKAATGKTLSDYASEKLWQPMRAEHDALWSLDKKNGMEKAYCCFNSNARDFARFGKLVLNNGRVGDNQVVSEKYIKEATTPAKYLLDENNEPVDFYGFQWWIMNIGNKRYPYMRGILGQYVFVVPEKNAIIVRLGHRRSEDYFQHHTWDSWIYLEEGLKLLD